MKGLFGLIHESSRRYPEKIFVKSMNRSWTYSEVEALALRVSGYLTELGVHKGDRVIIFCDNSIQYIAAFFGILRLNAVAVPLNPAKMADNILYVIEKCSPKLIVTCSSPAGKLDRIDCRRFCVNVMDIDRCGLLESPWYAGCSDGGQDFSVEENDAAVILFTSGTTAYPKGATLTHGNLVANTEAIVEYLKLTSADSVLMTLPFTYSYGNSVLLTHAFIGASLVIDNSTAYPFKILEGIKTNRVSGFSTVGSYINLMLKCIKNTAGEDFLSDLRYITFAGESTNNDDIRFIRENYPGIRIYVMYGQTEASARLSYLDPDMIPAKLGSIGKGLRNVKLRVVDEAGECVRPGETGEIIASGPNIMKYYWEDPDATKQVLKDGWLFTGDIATVDKDGYIYIKGRKTDMIKYMGHRISPLEIENAINGSSLVNESAVVEGVLDGAPAIKAFIVPVGKCSLEEIKRYVYSRLPLYMRPQLFETIGQLPRTDTGKIMRSALRRYQCAE